MKHVAPPWVRPSSIKNIDPVLTIGQDIAKFVIDWAHVSKIKKIDSIIVNIEGTKIDAQDLQQLLSGIFMDTIAKKAEINVKKKEPKHFCREHHVSFKKICPTCGSPGIIELPKIKIKIKSKNKKAEIHI